MLFDSFEQVISTADIDAVADCIAAVEAAACSGAYAVGYVAYEAASAFDPALTTREAGGRPLIWFGLCRNYQPVGKMMRNGELQFADWASDWSNTRYSEAFDIVQRHIHDGDTYQINLTFPLRSTFSGKPEVCYARMLDAQSSSFCGLLQTEASTIISASPELFFERWGTRIRTRPMKGTRRRAPEYYADCRQGEELALAGKDRAENVMIVDLLRNDIGRVARTGSVNVDKLFNVERYPTVWQMTSTVEADIDADTSLLDIFRALFPCGSVTGAPKVKTMEFIAGLETSPRGVYCGAFGIVLPGGDCVFNVPIRTLTLEGDAAVYPVGSGIVADSECENEYEECLLKSRVLSIETPDFQLLETMAWRKNQGWQLLEEHIARIIRSAEYFDFSLDGEQLRTALLQEADDWVEPMRSRLLVGRSGEIQIESKPMSGFDRPLRSARLAQEPVDSSNPFLYHKTTHRDIYDQHRAQCGNVDEVILFNECGEVTEGSITNVAVLIDGSWWTPPVECGLLPGTMREELLKTGKIRERVVTVDELRQADGVRLMNSVRGHFDVTLVD